MKSVEIITEELKKEGIECAEEVAKVVIKTIFEKITPRLATEAEEPTVKAIAGFLLPFVPMGEKALLEMAEKINPAD